ncbi:unnamed protein product, partial [Mesorhabditis belari]|uniref:Uncharacterized protein n=1 Tax=Mesorhabditis belari TaxID=2138241 RepID=A0AAF3E7Y1_9BILA
MNSDLKSVLCWVKSRKTYVASVPNVTFRVKASTKFGETVRGFSDGEGVVSELKWENLISLAPTCLEINHSRNPFPELLQKLLNGQSEELIKFFSRLRTVSIFGADIKAADLTSFFKNLSLLAAFSYSDFYPEDGDWTRLAQELSTLQLRALDASGGRGVVDDLLAKVDISLLRLSGNPGFRVSEFQKSSSIFPTVRVLAVSELLDESDTDAEKLLSILTQKFPSLEALIFDWSVVDPGVMIDERTKKIVKQLVDLTKNLEAFAIIAYTPCPDTKAATGEIARLLAEGGLHEMRWRQFASRGLSNDKPNFSLLIGGSSAALRERIEEAFVERRQSSPHIRHLLPLIDSDTNLHKPSLVIDFGGMDSAQIQRDLENRNFTQAE